MNAPPTHLRFRCNTTRRSATMRQLTPILSLLLLTAALLVADQARASCTVFANQSGIGSSTVTPAEHGRQNCKAAGYVNSWGVPRYHSYRIVTEEWAAMHDPFWRTEPVPVLVARRRSRVDLCDNPNVGHTNFSGSWTLTDSITVSTTVTLSLGVKANLNELMAKFPVPGLNVTAAFTRGDTNSSSRDVGFTISATDQLQVSACHFTDATFDIYTMQNGVAITNLVEHKVFQFRCRESGGFFAPVTDWMDDQLDGPYCDFSMQEARGTMPRLEMGTMASAPTSNEHDCGTDVLIDDLGTTDPSDDIRVPDPGDACMGTPSGNMDDGNDGGGGGGGGDNFAGNNQGGGDQGGNNQGGGDQGGDGGGNTAGTGQGGGDTGGSSSDRSSGSSSDDGGEGSDDDGGDDSDEGEGSDDDGGDDSDEGEGEGSGYESGYDYGSSYEGC